MIGEAARPYLNEITYITYTLIGENLSLFSFLSNPSLTEGKKKKKKKKKEKETAKQSIYPFTFKILNSQFWIYRTLITQNASFPRVSF